MTCQICVALKAISAATTPPDVVCVGSPENAVIGVESPNVTDWLAFVRVVGARTSVKYATLPIAKNARLLKFATAVGTPGSGFVAVFDALHVGAAGFEMSTTPKKFAPAPLNPGCVTMIFVPITAIVGGVHAPDVAGDAGTFPAVTPEIVTNAFDTML
ncbi:hypothetical protein [Burkholderia anthina]|uniref:hypothetical protein n=1 Tax=Burkholderia anthina TaxID=179879 RepID=UPI0021AB1FB0|nr:hypothetical protein [Burkholderia anthina]